MTSMQSHIWSNTSWSHCSSLWQMGRGCYQRNYFYCLAFFLPFFYRMTNFFYLGCGRVVYLWRTTVLWILVEKYIFNFQDEFVILKTMDKMWSYLALNSIPVFVCNISNHSYCTTKFEIFACSDNYVTGSLCFTGFTL